MPCTISNGTMFGVAAIDISLAELFSELILFPYGQYSYGIVTDIKGNFYLRRYSIDITFNL